MLYRVTWAIDVDAETVEGAAREALAAQRAEGSIATVFSVRPAGGGQSVTVDLDAVDLRAHAESDALDATIRGK
jgi:hypothetical protein